MHTKKLAFAAILALTALHATPAAAQQEFKAGISDPVNTVLAWWMGEAGGFYGAQGLKGGVIGVSTAGSESDTTVNLALERFGLKRSDVVFKDLGGGPARLAAVKAGEVKATMLNEPFNTFAREQGVNVLLDLAAEQTPWLFSGITVRTSSLRNARERESLKRFLKATIEGNYLALTDQRRAKEVLTKELHNTTP